MNSKTYPHPNSSQQHYLKLPRYGPKCPPTDKMKTWYMNTHTHTHTHTHTRILFSQKQSEILPFTTTWMDLEGIMLNEISQTEILYDITHMESRK